MGLPSPEAFEEASRLSPLLTEDFFTSLSLRSARVLAACLVGAAPLADDVAGEAAFCFVPDADLAALTVFDALAAVEGSAAFLLFAAFVFFVVGPVAASRDGAAGSGPAAAA
ncbi:MAG TPA: hypothetical protein DCQ30_01965, partial [Acidimicrobiaceae bacterium]|nr:hypothetical protein [Acidimicrobiaceae bacterium]